MHAFCCAVRGCPWPCFLFLYYLHQRAARWLKEQMQKSLNPFFMNTVRKAFCCPFSSGELGWIWKRSEIKVNSWVQVPTGLCFFLKPNPSMFQSEDFYKMLLVCFPCPPVCHHCVSAWVLWGNQATSLLFVNVLIMFSVSTSYSGGFNHSEFIGLFWTCLSHYRWCTHNTLTLAPEECTPKCNVLWDEQGLVWGRAASFCSVIS